MMIVAKNIGPFHDCTSNQVSLQILIHLNYCCICIKGLIQKQAIAFGKLSDPANAQLIQDSLSEAKSLSNKFADVGGEALAVEIAVCKQFKYGHEYIYWQGICLFRWSNWQSRLHLISTDMSIFRLTHITLTRRRRPLWMPWVWLYVLCCWNSWAELIAKF